MKARRGEDGESCFTILLTQDRLNLRWVEPGSACIRFWSWSWSFVGGLVGVRSLPRSHLGLLPAVLTLD